MFVDASALCAILLGEPEQADLRLRIATAAAVETSPVAVWETVRALVRERVVEVPIAYAAVQAFLDVADITVTPIGPEEQGLAIEAFDRFGKGRHPAALNMGDCFAYACARSRGVPLLYKGDDFSRTDIDGVVADRP